jgi:hypothetical protein
MACDVPTRDGRGAISKRRVGFAAAAGAMAAVAIALDTEQAPNLLLMAAGVVLAVGVGIPAVNAAEGAHPIITLLAALVGRRYDKPKVADLQDEFLDAVSRVTLDVTLLEPRAVQLAREAIGRGASAWIGPVDQDCFKYLLCRAVQLAMKDAWRHPEFSEGDPPGKLAALTRQQRAILALRQSDLDDSEIAAMLDCSLEVIAAVPPGDAWSER